MEVVKGYKGFDHNMQCRGLQYKENEKMIHEGEPSLCNKGLHFCENPLDVLRYYPILDSNAKPAQYREVDAGGVITEKEKGDSKRSCTELLIGAKIDLKHILKVGIELCFSKKTEFTESGDYSHAATSGNSSHAATSGYYSHAATSGNSSHAATSGYYSHAATSGNSSPAATSGNSSHAATSGNSSHAATSGNYSHAATSGNSSPAATSGYYSHAATSGNYSPAATSGNSSHAATSGNSSHAATSGKNSIACSIGRCAKAKSSVGNWIVLSEYDNGGNVVTVKTFKVDGKKIKTDTFYCLKNKKLQEVSE